MRWGVQAIISATDPKRPYKLRGAGVTKSCALIFAACLALAYLVACNSDNGAGTAGERVISPDPHEEIRAVVMSIKSDIESSNIEGLKALHLESEKFTKFGPRSFERQDVAATNESEAAFFSSIKNAKYEARDLQIDVFDDEGIATYYPDVSFVKDGNEVEVSGRQTLVFLKTDVGWKLVHEHGTLRRP